MLEPLLNSSTIPLLEHLAAFAERRQEVLAGNVANIDTPGYRMRDLPTARFQRALEAAVARRNRPVAPGDAYGSTAPAFPRDLFRAVEAKPNGLTFHDANNRSVEQQMMELTKNAMLQNFALQVMTAQLNQLQAVITERP